MTYHHTPILRTQVVSRFSCLGDRCPDTCCRGWSMQVDEATLARYRQEAPELAATVESDETGWAMRKNSAGLCVKLEDGLCGIHKTHGERFLGDACHFYPRITRRLGVHTIMTATTSCPEIVRLVLEDNDPTALSHATAERLPESIKEYLSADIHADDALAVHQVFMATAASSEESVEMTYARIANVSRSLEHIERKNWHGALPVYLKIAHTLLPAVEPNPADPFNLLHALAGLIIASKKPMSERLSQTIGDMEKALKVTLDWQQALITTSEESVSAYQALQRQWQDTWAVIHAPTLRRVLQMQLSMALFPFAGLGESLSEKITLIGVRLATIKLALMCSCGINGGTLPQDVVVRIVQSLSRFMDHLGNPAFSLQIYAETGWNRESRMRGVLGA